MIQLLNSAANVYFDASEAAGLLVGLGFDATVFADAGYQPITGLGLAMLLTNRISSILGPEDAASVITAKQTQQFHRLETLFQKLP